MHVKNKKDTIDLLMDHLLNEAGNGIGLDETLLSTFSHEERRRRIVAVLEGHELELDSSDNATLIGIDQARTTIAANIKSFDQYTAARTFSTDARLASPLSKIQLGSMFRLDAPADKIYIIVPDGIEVKTLKNAVDGLTVICVPISNPIVKSSLGKNLGDSFLFLSTERRIVEIA